MCPTAWYVRRLTAYYQPTKAFEHLAGKQYTARLHVLGQYRMVYALSRLVSNRIDRPVFLLYVCILFHSVLRKYVLTGTRTLSDSMCCS